jgi:hypothetical protein
MQEGIQYIFELNPIFFDGDARSASLQMIVWRNRRRAQRVSTGGVLPNAWHFRGIHYLRLSAKKSAKICGKLFVLW